MNAKRVSRRTALVTTILWLGVSGCHGWTNLQSHPPSPTELDGVHRVWVELEDGRRVELRGEIRVVGDSLIGAYRKALPYHATSSGRQAVALEDIATIRTRHVSAGSTLLLGFVIWGGALAICLSGECGPEFRSGN